VANGPNIFQMLLVIKVKWEVTCTLLNGDVVDHLAWPLITELSLFYIFGVVFRVTVTDEDSIFKSGIEVDHKKF